MWFFKCNKTQGIQKTQQTPKSNTTTIIEFFNCLADIISKDKCESSYTDFTYTNVPKNSELYIAFSSNQNFIDNKLIHEFNILYDKKYKIKDIKNIVVSDVLIKTSPRGCTPTDFYNISFTVYYNNLTLIAQ